MLNNVFVFGGELTAAVECQDLKTAKFTGFFSDTRKACDLHLGDGANKFFDLLASQIVQRLLKSAVTGKVGQVNTQFITSFIA